ncbi:hypothetical protein, partial [uncultured Bifidobacterium sp.]|uniref:hypothetical protein n=1 Tax=uncultured Bifidobacterium sp. TaxID=165187 RepID=UPI0025854FAD
MAVETPGMPGAFIYCSGFSGTYQKTSDMCPELGGFIITVSTTAGQEPQQFPTIEPFLLLSPFSPRWSTPPGFFLV